MRRLVLFLFALMLLAPIAAPDGLAWAGEPAHAVGCELKVPMAEHHLAGDAATGAEVVTAGGHCTVCHACQPVSALGPTALPLVTAEFHTQPAHHARAFLSAGSAPDFKPPIL
jgi:uncharacterized membrane protein